MGYSAKRTNGKSWTERKNPAKIHPVYGHLSMCLGCCWNSAFSLPKKKKKKKFTSLRNVNFVTDVTEMEIILLVRIPLNWGITLAIAVHATSMGPRCRRGGPLGIAEFAADSALRYDISKKELTSDV